jgi:hypothetical protein
MYRYELCIAQGVRVRVSQSHFTTDSQSVRLGVKPRLGRMTRYLFSLKVTVLSI